jgi:hypothetical protein
MNGIELFIFSPGVVGFEGVLHAGALMQGHGETGVAAAVGHCHDAILICKI